MMNYRLDKFVAVDIPHKMHAKERCILLPLAYAGARPGKYARQLLARRPLTGSLCDNSADNYMRIYVSGGSVSTLDPVAASGRLAYPTSDTTL